MGNDTKKQQSVVQPHLQQQQAMQQQQQQTSLQSAKIQRSSQSAYTDMPVFDDTPKKSNWWMWLAAAVIVCGIGYKTYQHTHTPVSTGEISESSVKKELQNITVASADLDQETTTQVRQELNEGKMPEVLKNADPVLIEKVKNGSANFYKFMVFDTAAEDGDIVQLSINGLKFGFVTMSNAGTVISIPLSDANQVIGVKAIHDGGGGVTFGAQTSTGQIKTKVMSVGDEDSFQAGVK